MDGLEVNCPNLMRTISLFVALLLLGCSVSPASVDVKKPLVKPLVGYARAIIEVESSGESETAGVDAVFLEDKMSDSLKVLGISQSFGADDARLRVTCTYENTWGLPRIIRHFKVKATYIGVVNIKLVDVPSGELIGEVEYVRPRLSTNPSDFVKMMFDELLKASPK